jgi:hypothetical protein
MRWWTQGQKTRVPGPLQFPVALSLAIPHEGSILYETTEAGHEEAVGNLNNIILRLLATARQED